MRKSKRILGNPSPIFSAPAWCCQFPKNLKNSQKFTLKNLSLNKRLLALLGDKKGKMVTFKTLISK